MDGTDPTETSEDEGSDFIFYDGDSDDFSQEVPATADASSSGAAEQLGPAEVNVELQSQKKRARKRPRNFDTIKASKAYKQAQLTEAELEEEIADACGLHPHGLNNHEHGLLNDDLNEELYFKIRNHILALWRGDVTQYLSEEAAAARMPAKHRPLVSAAWRFLDREGYINWGVAPAILARAVPDRAEAVVVIGAGLAGLSAARQLRNHGYKVVVIEGADRPGGRVHTHRMEAGGEVAVADLGGSIITGIHSNPLAVLARQLNIPLHDISTRDVPLFLRDGSKVDGKVDKESDVMYNKLLARSADLRQQMPSATAISLQASLKGLWQRVMLEQRPLVEQPLPQQQQQQAGAQQALATGSPSVTGPDVDMQSSQAAAGRQWGGRQLGKQANGGGRAPQQQRRRQSGADRTSNPATRSVLESMIHWHMANNEFSNAAPLRTLSMKYWDLDDAFEHQGAHVFLPGGNLRLLQALAADMPILYNTPVRLLQYCSSGVRVHTQSQVFEADAAVVTVPLGVLKRPDGLRFQPTLPTRKQVAIKRLGFGCLNKVVLMFPYCFWGDNRDIFGHVTTDSSQRGLHFMFYAYHGISGGAVLAALVAGDAAMSIEQQSEEQAVAGVMQLLRDVFAPQGVDVPEPLQSVMTRWASNPLACGSYSSVAVGSAGAADYEALSQPLAGRVFFAGEATTTKYPATMHGAFDTGMREAANVMAALTQERWDAVRPHLPKGVPDVDALEAFKGEELVIVSQALEQVFSPDSDEGFEPDLEFGVFKAVCGPEGSGLEDKALVQVSFGPARHKPKQGVAAVYLVLPRCQLEALQDLGDDDLRVAAVRELGGELVGRPLSTGGVQLLEAVLKDRHGVGLTDAEQVQ